MTTTERRLARPAEIRALVQVRRPVVDPVDRRLARALSIDELRTVARRRTPRAIFDYVDGGADLELTMRRNVAAFEQVSLGDLTRGALPIVALGSGNESAALGAGTKSS